MARNFPNQHHVVVKGLHFVQEDSPDEVGRAIAGWLEQNVRAVSNQSGL
jgi:haloalkane dehalogenase